MKQILIFTVLVILLPVIAIAVTAETGNDIGDNVGTVNQIGEIIWKFDTRGIVGSNPVFSNGVIYVGNKFGENEHYGNLYALDAVTGIPIWEFPTGGIVGSDPAVFNDTVFVGDYDGNLYAIDAAKGLMKWKFSSGGNFYSSPTVSNGVIFIRNENGNLYAVDSTSGSKIWESPVAGINHFTPAVSNGVVYMGDNPEIKDGGSTTFHYGTFYAIDAISGKIIREISVFGISSSPTISDGTIYVGIIDQLLREPDLEKLYGLLYAIDEKSGTILWQFSTDGIIHTTPIVSSGIVFVGTDSGSLYAIDAKTGSEKWKYNSEEPLFSSPAVSNGVVYASLGWKIFAFDANTGSNMRQISTIEGGITSPSVFNGILSVGGIDGFIYAIRIGTNPISVPNQPVETISPIINSLPTQNLQPQLDLTPTPTPSLLPTPIPTTTLLEPYPAESYDEIRNPITHESLKYMIQSGRQEDALRTLDLLIQNNPNSPLLHKAVGDILRNTSPKEALSSYNFAVSQGSQNPNLFIRKAEIEQNLGRIDLALETYQKGLEQNPANIVLLKKQSELMELKERRSLLDNSSLQDSIDNFNEEQVFSQKAILDYRSQIHLERELRDPVSLKLVSDLVKEGQLDEALEAVQLLIQQSPEDPYLYQIQGDILWLESPMDSYPAYDQAEKFESQNPVVYERKGDLERIMGDESSALKTYQQGLNYTPNNSTLLEKQGDLYSNIGVNSEAEVSYKRARNNTTGQNNTVRIIEKISALNSANSSNVLSSQVNQNSFSDYLDVDMNITRNITDHIDHSSSNELLNQDSCPDIIEKEKITIVPDICRNPCDLITKEPISEMIHSGRIIEAQYSLNRLIEAYPSTPCLYQVKGDLLYNYSLTTSLSSYELAIAYGSNDAWLYEKMGDIACSLDNYEKALGLYQKGLQLQPNNSNLSEKQGNLFFKNGKYQQALEAFDRALVCIKDPEMEKRIRQQKIHVFQKIGKNDEIILELNKLNPTPTPLPRMSESVNIPQISNKLQISPSITPNPTLINQEEKLFKKNNTTPVTPIITERMTNSESNQMPETTNGLSLWLLLLASGIFVVVLVFLYLRSKKIHKTAKNLLVMGGWRKKL